MTERTFKAALRTLFLSGLICLLPGEWCAAEPIDMGSRLELLADGHVVHSLSGGAALRIQHPVPREVALVHDAPWEGNNCCYHTVFRDGGIYRMYYRGSGLEVDGKKLKEPHHAVTCYAESVDGIRWTKPNLGLVDFAGSKDNNIIAPGMGAHNFCPMKDANPAASPEAAYKALAGLGGGLRAFQSADGVHWKQMRKEPVIAKGAFDSQNLAFWDTVNEQYRAYFRDFREGRDIRTATSSDFLHWTEPIFVDYVDGRKTELYTNQILPYYRAPHLLVGFPTRYIAGRGLLTPLNEHVTSAHARYGNDYTDGGFMTSRDRQTFRVWPEALIRPGTIMQGHWMYGFAYQAWGLVETQMELAEEPLLGYMGGGNTAELSLYAREGGWVGTSCRLRRYTIRLDGFVSVNAPMSGGEMLSKPLVFEGERLVLNYATSAAGSLRVEIQDEAGKPIPGFALADCQDLFGNTVGREPAWNQSADVSALAGRPIRLRFALKDADLYSFQFRPGT